MRSKHTECLRLSHLVSWEAVLVRPRVQEKAKNLASVSKVSSTQENTGENNQEQGIHSNMTQVMHMRKRALLRQGLKIKKKY